MTYTNSKLKIQNLKFKTWCLWVFSSLGLILSFLSIVFSQELPISGYPTNYGVFLLIKQEPPKGVIGYNIYRREKGGEFLKINEDILKIELTEEEVKKILSEDTYFKLKVELEAKDFVQFKEKIKKKGLLVILKYLELFPLVFEGRCYFKDLTAEKGKTYEYIISEIYKDGSEAELEKEILSVKVEPKKLPKPEELKGYAGENSAKLEWKAGKEFSGMMEGEEMFTSPVGVNIYKRKEGEEKWEKKKIIPLPPAGEKEEEKKDLRTHLDTNLVNGIPYYYKLTSYNLAGEESEETDIIKIVPVDKSPPLAPEGVTAKIVENKLKLVWKANLEEDLSHYNIYRSYDSVKFEKINEAPVKGLEFVDEKAEGGKTLWHYITAVDYSGNESNKSEVVMTIVPDIQPPKPVKLIKAEGKKGEIEIEWEKSAETDLDGYAIYKGNKEDNLTEIATVLPENTKYVDKNQSSGVETYYAVVVIDKSTNRSKFSNILKARTIDDEPPEAPTGVALEESMEYIKLSWMENSEPDLAGYKIYRKSATEKEFMPIYTAQKGEKEFVDKEIKKAILYSYYITAYDNDKNESEKSEELTGRILDLQPPTTPKNFKCYLTKKYLVFTWDKIEEEDVAGYFIYVFEDKKDAYVRINKEPIKEILYVTENLSPNALYQTYKISAVDFSDNESNKSVNIYPTEEPLPKAIKEKLKEMGIKLEE